MMPPMSSPAESGRDESPAVGLEGPTVMLERDSIDLSKVTAGESMHLSVTAYTPGPNRLGVGVSPDALKSFALSGEGKSLLWRHDGNNILGRVEGLSVDANGQLQASIFGHSQAELDALGSAGPCLSTLIALGHDTGFSIGIAETKKTSMSVTDDGLLELSGVVMSELSATQFPAAYDTGIRNQLEARYAMETKTPESAPKPDTGDTEVGSLEATRIAALEAQVVQLTAKNAEERRARLVGESRSVVQDLIDIGKLALKEEKLETLAEIRADDVVKFDLIFSHVPVNTALATGRRVPAAADSASNEAWVDGNYDPKAAKLEIDKIAEERSITKAEAFRIVRNAEALRVA